MWSAYASQDKFHILMEYCCGGNLLERLKAAAAPMGEQQLAAQVRGICRGCLLSSECRQLKSSTSSSSSNYG